MNEFSREIISGIQTMERDLENPTFTWNGGTYNLVPSISEIRRELESGGFVVDLLLSATVLLQDEEGNQTFPGGINPQTQQKVVYQGNTYRINMVKYHPTGAYMRMIGVCPFRGV